MPKHGICGRDRRCAGGGALRSVGRPRPGEGSRGGEHMTKSELILRSGSSIRISITATSSGSSPPSSKRSRRRWRAATGSSCAASAPFRSSGATPDSAATRAPATPSRSREGRAVLQDRQAVARPPERQGSPEGAHRRPPSPRPARAGPPGHEAAIRRSSPIPLAIIVVVFAINNPRPDTRSLAVAAALDRPAAALSRRSLGSLLVGFPWSGRRLLGCRPAGGDARPGSLPSACAA